MTFFINHEFFFSEKLSLVMVVVVVMVVAVKETEVFMKSGTSNPAEMALPILIFLA